MTTATESVEVTVYPGMDMVLTFQATPEAAAKFAKDFARCAIRVEIGGSAKPGTRPLPCKQLWEDWPW